MNNIKSFIKKNTWLPMMETGWGNGYVVIPEGHKLNGIDYDELPFDAHGGLTFATRVSDLKKENWTGLPEDCNDNDWIIGFDTSHYQDNSVNWSKDAVQAETNNLLQQVIDWKE